MTKIIERLKAPFDPMVVSWRVGSTDQAKKKGMALAYIDARDVMERLDEVVGPENWQNNYSHAQAKTVCNLGIRMDGEWVWKSNGAGDTDFEGEKGALSDAFKRAAVLWGIGRYLYDIQSMWVEIEQRGRSYVIRKSEIPKLQKLLGVKSSYELRNDGEWETITEQLHNELLDVHSIDGLDKVKTAYRSIAKERGWNGSYTSQLAEIFADKQAEINGRVVNA